MTPTFTQLLTLSTESLVALGMTRREVAAVRRATTGHVRPLSDTWLRAFGRWGRTSSILEISTLVERDPQAVQDYARAMDLRWATSKRRLSQAQLAVGLWCDRRRPVRESCCHWGVLPAERMLLCSAVQVLLDDLGVPIEEVLGWRAAELDATWHSLGIEVSWETIREPLDLDQIIAEATAC